MRDMWEAKEEKLTQNTESIPGELGGEEGEGLSRLPQCQGPVRNAGLGAGFLSLGSTKETEGPWD